MRWEAGQWPQPRVQLQDREAGQRPQPRKVQQWEGTTCLRGKTQHSSHTGMSRKECCSKQLWKFHRYWCKAIFCQRRLNSNRTMLVQSSLSVAKVCLRSCISCFYHSCEACPKALCKESLTLVLKLRIFE